MANIYPFRAYRYTKKAGKLKDLVTQPYDKISPEMQQKYLGKSPNNLVRVILGPREDADNGSSNVYTRAKAHFEKWTSEGLIAQDEQPAFYFYSQEFTVPGSSERLTRNGFIGLGEVVPYEDGIIHRHEQTLSGPKKDRRQVLEHTKAHFGQIFMLYDDPTKEIDGLIECLCKEPLCDEVEDEYGVTHRIMPIRDEDKVRAIQAAMKSKKLLIADGHHRYETALAYRQDNPDSKDAERVMMTFVNMRSEGVRILATHRVIKELDGLDHEAFFGKAGKSFRISKLDSAAALAQVFAELAPEKLRIGVIFRGSPQVHLLERDRNGDLDVSVLHKELLGEAMGISEEAVREEKHLKYVRGLDTAAEMVTAGEAQAAFLLEPTTIEQVAETSFGGGVMPQKSTDFYPKLLTGVTMYRLEN